MRTPVYRFCGSNVTRVKSPFTVASSGHVDQSGLEPERQVLVEPDAQVALALRLLQVGERALLGAVVGARGELRRAAGPQLRIAGRAVAARGERGRERALDRGADHVELRLRRRRDAPDRGRDGEVGLAAEPPRRVRAGRDEARADLA